MIEEQDQIDMFSLGKVIIVIITLVGIITFVLQPTQQILGEHSTDEFIHEGQLTNIDYHTTRLGFGKEASLTFKDGFTFLLEDPPNSLYINKTYTIWHHKIGGTDTIEEVQP